MANIMTIGNVRGYIAKDGNAWLNAGVNHSQYSRHKKEQLIR